jgi:putative ABC transport system permease protein
MRALVRLLRALLHRPGTTVMILLVALVAAAAAATAPIYYSSARTSILRDSLSSAPVVERGFEVTRQGAQAGSLEPLIGGLTGAMTQYVPDARMRARAFEPPIYAVEATAYFADLRENLTLAWRSDVCDHLKLAQGRCAAKANEVIISDSLARSNKWRVGQQLAPPGWPPLTITGIYVVPDFNQLYWFSRGGIYFPVEDAQGAVAPDGPEPGDAMFTVRETVDTGESTPQGTDVIDQLINPNTVAGGDLDVLANAVNFMPASPGLSVFVASLQSGLPGLVGNIHDSWRTLAVTEFLIAVQLLVLVWLLMFLVVKDAVEARGAEIALMKLRGYKSLRLMGFGLAEPLALLAIALPAGVLLGWAISAGLAKAQLRPGMSVGLPALAWAAAAVATLGGVAAIATAGRRALRRSVVDQWRRTERHSTVRGWVVDAIALTAAVAGLIELRLSGQITSVGHGSLGLLEPGLLGLAIAVVASRLLPALCRSAFGATRRRGGLGAFLAVRHVARRPGGIRTTIILATAFALATFGVAAWSTGRANRALAAGVSVGAPVSFTVAPSTSKDLAAVVDQIDPSGTQALVVDSYYNSGAELLAVDPDRFARVAAWRDRFSSTSLADIAKKLQPQTAPSVVLDGDQLRIRLDVEKLSETGEVVIADIASPGGPPIQVDLGTIDEAKGPQVLTGRLVGCPCQLRDIVVSPSTTPGIDGGGLIKGTVVVNGVDVHKDGNWTTLTATSKADQWDAGGTGAVTSTTGKLQWQFTFPAASATTLRVADYPAQIPALVSSSLANNGGNAIQVNGLDGQAVTVQPIAKASAIPGATTDAVVVSRTFANRAAGGLLSPLTTQQVWTTAKAAPRIEAGLKKAGIPIVSSASAGSLRSMFDRQGPGLASVVFLADAIAAALLAAGAAVMGLVTAGRRRRYEYAALTATGASRVTIFRGLLIEQGGVLLFGALTGIVAGVIAAAVAVRGVPEFVTPPAVSLSYVPDFSIVIVALVIAIVGLLAVAVLSSWVLVAGVRADQLREAPS